MIQVANANDSHYNVGIRRCSPASIHSMIVCVCHRVSDRDIVRAVHEGCATFEDLQDELRCGTSCGRCHECAHEAFDDARGEHLAHDLARVPGETLPVVIPLRRAA
jgi:bacterioferritin-associated ferredoxin